MLYEQELKTFVDATTNFFVVAAQEPASIGSPYLMEGTPAVHEYTGVINISGNARRDFSRDFVISVPNVLTGEERPDVPREPGRRSFIIPINWRSHSAKLVVSLT